MKRTPRHRLLAALLTLCALIVGAMLPIGGVISAASAATNCPNGEGTFCFLAISAPESVVTGQVFTVHVAVTTDGTTVAKSDPCSRVAVTLFISDGEERTVTYTADTSGGTATFNEGVTYPGFPSLHATASNTG